MIICGVECTLRELSLMDVLTCTKEAHLLEEELLQDDFDIELTKLLCENGTLAWMSVMADGKALFDSPKEALRSMSLSELAMVYAEYSRLFLEEGACCIECAINEQFKAKE